MKKSGLIQRQEEMMRVVQEATRKTYLQYCTDTACIALNELGWGKERIDNFLTIWGKVYDFYLDAMKDTPETDYFRTKMDERIIPICKDEYYKPFEERYEYLKKMRY